MAVVLNFYIDICRWMDVLYFRRHLPDGASVVDPGRGMHSAECL